MKLVELSEAQLVSHFRGSFPRDERTMIGIGDDCVQVAAPEGSFVVTTDVVVEDQYSHLSWPVSYEVSTCVAAQNLADIGAMGGRPSTLVASVVAPRDMDSNVFLDVIRGLGDRACEAEAGVVGGDLGAGEKLVISITAFGYCSGPVVCRGGARPGDVAAVSGTLGYSYAGLDLLEGGYANPSPRGVKQLGEPAPFIKTYRASGSLLGSGVAAAAASARVIMDLLDGPATDTGCIAQTSDVVAKFNQDAIGAETSQLAPAAHVCAVDPVRWILQGEEEHGVIVVFPPSALLPDGFRVVSGVRACQSDEEPQAMMDEAILRGV